MAGTKIDNFAVGDVNLTAIMDTLQGLRQGHFQLSLTEVDTAVEPEISSGSIVDINGSLVYFDADEEITGSSSDGVVYVKLIYSSGVVTAEFTNTAPVFDSAKNGWYGTSASSGHRYVAKMVKSGTDYTGKTYLDSANVSYIYETQLSNWTGTWNTGATQTSTLTFTADVQAIIALDITSKTLTSDTVSIDSITISSNTVVIVMTNRYNTNISNSSYSVVVTAAL